MRNLILAGAICLVPHLASAHAILVQSSPADQSSLPAGEQTLTLRFNSRIDHQLSRIALEGTNAQMTLPLEKNGPADTLTAKATLTPGTYVVRWQVLATDGHMTRGVVNFTVVPK